MVQSALKHLFHVFDGKEKSVTPDQVNIRRYVDPAKPMPQPIMKDDYLEVNWTITRDGLPDWDLTWVCYILLAIFLPFSYFLKKSIELLVSRKIKVCNETRE